jgi:HSP20 family protein
MGALTPWTGITSFRTEMDRLFDRFLEPAWKEMGTLGAWEPKVDMSETKDAVVVTAEIPGVDQKDIEVSLRDGMLTIKGEKQEEKEEKDKRFHRVERSYGAFMRAVQLPAAVDASKVSAAFKNGVVTVTVPKTAESKGTTIPVKAA